MPKATTLLRAERKRLPFHKWLGYFGKLKTERIMKEMREDNTKHLSKNK